MNMHEDIIIQLSQLIAKLNVTDLLSVSKSKWDELVDCHKNLTNAPHFLNSTSKIKDLVQGIKPEKLEIGVI